MTQDRLKELLSYNPNTGVFTWKKAKGGCPPGKKAGSVNSRGYLFIGIDGQIYRAHRLAWLWVNGCWPASGLDHKNGDQLDNRIANLREANQWQNSANSKTRRNGLKGVGKTFSGWMAKIRSEGKEFYLGHFRTEEEAHQAYCEAAFRLNGEFARFE